MKRMILGIALRVVGAVLIIGLGAFLGEMSVKKQAQKQAYEQELAREISQRHTIPVIYEPDEEKIEKAEEIIEVEETYNADFELMARVVYAESRGERFVGKVAVATTIINRSESWGKTIEEVVFQENQYVVADKTNDECRRAVIFAWANRDLYPHDLYWFNGEGYSYGYPYMKLGNHFFSTESEHNENL